jgi:hypothetical protein
MCMFCKSLFVLLYSFCSSSIYGFWLPLWYLQSLLKDKHIVRLYNNPILWFHDLIIYFIHQFWQNIQIWALEDCFFPCILIFIVYIYVHHKNDSCLSICLFYLLFCLSFFDLQFLITPFAIYKLFFFVLLFFSLVIVLFVLRFTASDYPFCYLQTYLYN